MLGDVIAANLVRTNRQCKQRTNSKQTSQKMIVIVVIGCIVLIFYLISKSTEGIKSNNTNCSFCSAFLTRVTRVENRLGLCDDGKKELCINCFSKVIEEGRETGRQTFSDEEIIKIIRGITETSSEKGMNNEPLEKHNWKDVIEKRKEYREHFLKTGVYPSEIIERPLPKSNLKQYVPSNEIHEEQSVTRLGALVLNSLAQITYTDAQGQKSERRITIKSIYDSLDNDYMIDAYCHEKQAVRTFKLSRISRLVDMETGETFNDPSKYFLERYTDSPIGQITKCFQELESEILILTFMARADGHLLKKEREIIAGFIQQKHNSSLDQKLLDDEIRRTYCESIDFRKALKNIKTILQTDKAQIIQLATDIINTDKKTDPIELGILELIKTELKEKKAEGLT